MKIGFKSIMMGAVIFVSSMNAVGAESSFENATVSGISFATVGDDNDCDFRVGDTKIQDAINDNSQFDEVRIAGDQTYTENLIITDRSVKLRGGYNSCADAIIDNQDTDQHATIDGDVASRATILMNSTTTDIRVVTLENLRLINGGGLEGEVNVGGVAGVDTNLVLFLERMEITNNSSNQAAAGGINLFNSNGTSTSMTANDIRVQNNEGVDGGGLYCNGPNNSVEISGASSIAFNSAENGGGAYITNGCELNMYSGQEFGNLATLFDGINSNEATENGGGIYVSAGASANFNSNTRCVNSAFGQCIIFAGSQSTTVNITANSAGQDGGGVYVIDPDSAVNFNTGVINLNTAGQDGGGVYVDNQATFNMFWQGEKAEPFTPLYRTCFNSESCSELSGNKAVFGGAIFVNQSGLANVLRTHIKGNQGHAQQTTFGAVSYILGNDSQLVLEGSIITGNGAGTENYLFRNFDGINGNRIALRLLNSTVADNDVATEIFGLNQSSLNVAASIVSEPNAVAILQETNDDGNATFECVVVNEETSLQNSTLFDVVEDGPGFVDRNNGDYHIDPVSSPAVDLCESIVSSDLLDIDLEARGFDDANVSDFSGPFDAGADETYTSDVIFKNGFE